MRILLSFRTRWGMVINMVEELVYQALCEFPALTAKITTYAGNPAIFFQNAPHDKDIGWSTIQFPRIDYALDWQYNPERNAAGALMVNVYCLNNPATCEPPESISGAIQEALQNLFLTVSGTTYALAWSRSDLFDSGGGEEPLVLGMTMSFDVLAFPVQYTTVPDPIEGLSIWLKANIPDARIIGVDAFPALVRATSDAPIIYCRLQTDGSQMRNSYSVAWITAGMAVHVFSPDTIRRQFLCRNIVNALSMDGEVWLTDDSQMLIKRTLITTGSDPLHQGQISVTGEYGVLRKPQVSETLNHAHFERRMKLDGYKERGT